VWLLDVFVLRFGSRGGWMRGRLAYRVLWRICVTEKPAMRGSNLSQDPDPLTRIPVARKP